MLNISLRASVKIPFYYVLIGTVLV